VDNGYCLRDRERLPDGTLGRYSYVFTDVPSQVLKTSNGLPVPGNQGHKKKRVKKKVTKISARAAGSGQAGIGDKRSKPAVTTRFVSEEALDRVRKLAPGWDRQWLLAKFYEWEGSKNAVHLNAAFLGWVKKFVNGRKPGDD
jgi:hypothetical protein